MNLIKLPSEGQAYVYSRLLGRVKGDFLSLSYGSDALFVDLKFFKRLFRLFDKNDYVYFDIVKDLEYMYAVYGGWATKHSDIALEIKYPPGGKLHMINIETNGSDKICFGVIKKRNTLF